MRILFVKTSSLGDVIHNCPAVSDVRRSHPDATIDWVVEEAFAEVVTLHPAVRHAVPVSVRRWRSRLFMPEVWREIGAFRRRLSGERYDLVIDTQGLLKSALISRTAHGVRHGLDARSAREPLASRFYDVRHPVPRELHAVERNRRLTAAALGSRGGGTCDYGLVPPGGDPLGLGRPYCVLLSMSSRPDKLWPDEHWTELARALEGLGLASVLPWGSGAERERCRRIVSRAGCGTVPGALSLRELATAMAKAHAVFGVDTGLAHLAAALGTRAIGLYVSTDSARTGLYGADRIANLGGAGQVPAPGAALDALASLA